MGNLENARWEIRKLLSIKSKNMTYSERQSIVALELNEAPQGFKFAYSIESALAYADRELQLIKDSKESLNKLKPECDKTDWALAASSGALCGIIDIFLVGNTKNSPLGDMTDRWFSNRIKHFAKLNGWKGPRGKSNPTASAIGFLERKFKVPYDQRGCGDAIKDVLDDITPSNHHFKSLAHNPSLMGLFFSILDQFTGSSHFVSNTGDLISINADEDGFALRGNSIPAKFFCAFANWFGHLMSDVGGSSGSKGHGSRGKGIPSPLWTWMNSLIAIKRKLNIPASEFDKEFNELAVSIYNEGYDARFQTTQAIPVFVNSIIVRTFYCVRRYFSYRQSTEKQDRCFKDLWEKCKPFGNPTIKRMLTIAHGVFCLLDVGDATLRGFAASGFQGFDVKTFVLHVNLVGIGRFSVCLYGEAKDAIYYQKSKREVEFSQREKIIIEDYIDGLKALAVYYDDKDLISFISDFENGELYVAFKKSARLALQRGVPQEKVLETKKDIDNYFNRK